MLTLTLQSSERRMFIDITHQVSHMVEAQGWRQGAVLLHNPHTTAGLTVNEGEDPDVRQDLLRRLEGLVPYMPQVDRHQEGNADAHLQATLCGASLLIPLEAGRLVLGTWQAIYFCEFDGPRHRQVHVSLLAAG